MSRQTVLFERDSELTVLHSHQNPNPVEHLLGCGGTRDQHDGCAAKNFVDAVLSIWTKNLRGMFPAPC